MDSDCAKCVERAKNGGLVEEWARRLRGTWAPICHFQYEKKEYWVIFRESPRPVLCWPNAGNYEPIHPKKLHLPSGHLGKPLLVWTGKTEDVSEDGVFK